MHLSATTAMLPQCCRNVTIILNCKESSTTSKRFVRRSVVAAGTGLNPLHTPANGTHHNVNSSEQSFRRSGVDAAETTPPKTTKGCMLVGYAFCFYCFFVVFYVLGWRVCCALVPGTLAFGLPTFITSRLCWVFSMSQSMTRELVCLLYTSPSPRDRQKSRMPSSA